MTFVLVGMAAAFFLYVFTAGGLDGHEKRRVAVIMVLFVFAAIFWSAFMWFQRSVSWMHGTSVPGVSFTRVSHWDGAAPAPAGTSSIASAQSGMSQKCRNRDPIRRGIESLPLR